MIEKDLLTVNASKSCRPALMIDKRNLVRFRESLVHGKDVAVLRVSRVTPALAMLTGGCRSQLFPDSLRRLKEADGIIHRFGHLQFPIRPQDPGCI
jgi:hypothetical protein